MVVQEALRFEGTLRVAELGDTLAVLLEVLKVETSQLHAVQHALALFDSLFVDLNNLREGIGNGAFQMPEEVSVAEVQGLGAFIAALRDGLIEYLHGPCGIADLECEEPGVLYDHVGHSFALPPLE